MHESANIYAKEFLKIYGKEGLTVLEVGGRDIGGSTKGTLQEACESCGMKYVCLD